MSTVVSLDRCSMSTPRLRSAIAGAPEILFVAAAGNEDEDNVFGEFVPSSLDLPNLISVAAVDRAGDETARSFCTPVWPSVVHPRPARPSSSAPWRTRRGARHRR